MSRRKGERTHRNTGFKDSLYHNGCPVYCAYCFMELPREQATVDHVVPLRRGGADRWTNMLIACYPCNVAKEHDDRTPPTYKEEWSARLGDLSFFKNMQNSEADMGPNNKSWERPSQEPNTDQPSYDTDESPRLEGEDSDSDGREELD